ncbi:hypothetical protein DL96DRAFT_1821667 [Flagelloscypha sp. PMI_526]|nr:hypothetical protein DL96DRAFT_1821667 [Flagelloscypha sp. PMI_526]
MADDTQSQEQEWIDSYGAILQSVGQMVQVNGGLSIVRCVLYGFFIALIAYGGRIQLRHFILTTPGKILFVNMILLFILATIDIVISSIMTFLVVNEILVKSPQVSLMEKMGGMAENPGVVGRLEVVESAVTALAFFMADAAVLFRATMIWGKPNLFTLVPIILLVTFLATSIAYIIFMAQYSANPELNLPINALQITSWSLSLATNVCSTGIVAAKAWYHHAFLKCFYLSPRTSKGERILILLIESGAVYCCLQIGFIASNIYSTDADSQSAAIVANVFLVACTQLSCIYPTLILVLVSMRYASAANTPAMSRRDHPSLFRQTTTTTTTSSSESPRLGIGEVQFAPRFRTQVVGDMSFGLDTGLPTLTVVGSTKSGGDGDSKKEGNSPV